jgi:hypothetical protein
MYEHWTDQQRGQATGRWVSTEHEGPPPDNTPVLVWTPNTHNPEPDPRDAVHGIGMYVEERETWVIQFFATPGLDMYGALGYKSVWYWQCLTLPE